MGLNSISALAPFNNAVGPQTFPPGSLDSNTSSQTFQTPSTRSFQVNGETLVKVKGNGSLADPNASSLPKLWELGLTDEQGIVQIVPRWRNKQVFVDDFPEVPIEQLWMLASVTIRMTLIHYDSEVLDGVLANSMGGGLIAGEASFNGYAGYMAGAGKPLGGGTGLQERNNFYISLNLLSPVGQMPWRFPAAVLSESPISIPLGTRATAVQLVWLAIPYKSPISNGSGVELSSAGTPLWDHTLDT